MSTVVIGAGVAGLGCAVQLLQSGICNDVYIVTEHQTPQTLSDKSAALWRPVGEYQHDRVLVNQWAKQTRDHLLSVMRRAGSHSCGISMMSGYELSMKEMPPPFWKDLVFGFREIDQNELTALGLDAKTGWFYTSVVIDTSMYLEYLSREFIRLGGRFINYRVKDLMHLRDPAQVPADIKQQIQEHRRNKRMHAEEARDAGEQVQQQYELGDREDEDWIGINLVVNCAGLGARWLVPDTKVYPIRGQSIKVRCPSIHNFYCYLERSVLIIPRVHDVMLGGTYERKEDNIEVNERTRDVIMRRCVELRPDLKDAEIIEDLVGLRPGRERIRVELVTGMEKELTQRQRINLTQNVYFTDDEAEPELLGENDRRQNVEGIDENGVPIDPTISAPAFLPPAPRLEMDYPLDRQLQTPSPPHLIPVIHCYGHAGSGVTLHWGCGTTVAEWAKQLFTRGIAAAATAQDVRISERM